MFIARRPALKALLLLAITLLIGGDLFAQGRTKIRYALGDVISIDELPLLIAVERAKTRGVDVEIRSSEPGDGGK